MGCAKSLSGGETIRKIPDFVGCLLGKRNIHFIMTREPGLKTRIGICVALYSLGLACLPAAAQTPLQPSTAPAQVIDIQAQKSRYMPAVVHVKKGARVELRLHAIDHVHGFAIN